MMRGLSVAGVSVGVLLLLAGCSGDTGSTGSVGTLAKLDGWREDRELSGDSPFAVLELAYDAETARAMWEDNVANDLPTMEGKPLSPGVYGDLADVDLAEQVLGLYSSGQSGSCPEWVQDISTEDGTVVISTVEDLQGGDGCTEDYNPYRVLIAINQQDLPHPEELASADVIVDEDTRLSVTVGEYPLVP